MLCVSVLPFSFCVSWYEHCAAGGNSDVAFRNATD